MPRSLALALLIAVATRGSAQQVYVAATTSTVIASTEESFGSDQAQILYVANESSVPVIVFGVALSACENVKQWCAGQRTNIRIDPGQRRTVGRVDPKNNQQPYSYRWSFSFHPDSSDARMIAALREQGMVRDESGGVRRLQGAGAPPTPPAPPPAEQPGVDQPLSRAPLTAEERTGFQRVIEDSSAPPPPSFRFKVFYGSVLGSTMMPGAPIQTTGPCINPTESARYERDKTIQRTPWRPPVLPASFAPTGIPLPSTLRDTSVHGGEVLMRWVVDTTGETIPGSATVLESPHGQTSVQACTSVIGTRATPARDKRGVAIRAWVQMPVKVGEGTVTVNGERRTVNGER